MEAIVWPWYVMGALLAVGIFRILSPKKQLVSVIGPGRKGNHQCTESALVEVGLLEPASGWKIRLKGIVRGKVACERCKTSRIVGTEVDWVVVHVSADVYSR